MKNTYKELFDNPLLSDESNAITSISLRRFHNIHGIKNLYDKNVKYFNEHSKKIVQIFQENEKLIEKDIQQYIGALYNFSKSLVYLNKLEEVDKILKEFDDLKKRYPKLTSSPKLNTQLYETKAMILITNYLNSYRIEKLYLKLQPFINRFETFKPTMRIVTQLYMVRTFSFVHFCLGQYNESLNWDIFFLKEYENQKDSRMFLVTKLSSLISHFELNNTDYLPYAIRSTYRFIKKKNSELKFEKRILKFLRDVLSTIERSQILKMFTQLRSDLIEIAKDTKEDATNDFVYIEWLEHKITGKPLIDILKEKN